MKRLVEALPRVENSPQSPCWQQRQIARQNSALDDASGRRPGAAYAAPCDVDKPAAAPAKPLPPKTS